MPTEAAGNIREGWSGWEGMAHEEEYSGNYHALVMLFRPYCLFFIQTLQFNYQPLWKTWLLSAYCFWQARIDSWLCGYNWNLLWIRTAKAPLRPWETQLLVSPGSLYLMMPSVKQPQSGKVNWDSLPSLASFLAAWWISRTHGWVMLCLSHRCWHQEQAAWWKERSAKWL